MRSVAHRSLLLFGNSNADSPTTDDNGELIFVKPHVEEQSFGEFMDFVTRQEKSGIRKDNEEEIRYAQTRIGTRYSLSPFYLAR